MTEVVRLTFVSHAMTDAMAGGRFATDEPLNATGRRQVDAAIDLGIRSRSGEPGCTALTGPEKRTRQTAELLGLRATVEPRLADLDCGRWRGDVLGGVRPSRPGRMADRPDAGTARRRVRGRSGEPGGRLVGLPDHKPIADGGGNSSRGDPRGDPRRSRCTAEVVLAHRHCPSESHSHALPRTRLDATIGFLRGLRSHREDLPHDRQQPTHGAGTVVAGPAVAIVKDRDQSR